MKNNHISTYPQFTSISLITIAYFKTIILIAHQAMPGLEQDRFGGYGGVDCLRLDVVVIWLSKNEKVTLPQPVY